MKKRIVGDVTEYGQRSRTLLRQLKELRLAEETKSFYIERLKSASLSGAELASIENIVRFVEHVTKWEKDVREKAASADRDTRENLLRLQDEMKVLKQWLAVPRTRLFEQQVRECAMEVTRLDLLSVYQQVHGKMKTVNYELLTNEKKQRFVVMLRQLSCGSPMNADKEKSAREILRETQQCMTGLGITEQERLEIVQAMNMGTGHWFKCPDGMRLFTYLFPATLQTKNTVCILFSVPFKGTELRCQRRRERDAEV